jgi:hypothetical protein
MKCVSEGKTRKGRRGSRAGRGWKCRMGMEEGIENVGGGRIGQGNRKGRGGLEKKGLEKGRGR